MREDRYRAKVASEVQRLGVVGAVVIASTLANSGIVKADEATVAGEEKWRSTCGLVEKMLAEPHRPERRKENATDGTLDWIRRTCNELDFCRGQREGQAAFERRGRDERSIAP